MMLLVSGLPHHTSIESGCPTHSVGNPSHGADNIVAILLSPAHMHPCFMLRSLPGTHYRLARWAQAALDIGCHCYCWAEIGARAVRCNDLQRAAGQVGADQDGSFVQSLLERMALGNPKVASSRAAFGLRQQVRGSS